jgi:4-diphosphocytidyl-2-C-methyl-D-erythritol kinase
VLRAPAKINLFLEVLGKRPDGYHDLNTCMVAVDLCDTLTFRPAGDFRLTCDDPALSIGPDNLVWRAAEVLRQATGTTRGAHVNLAKRIPMAAGLGGGSSDAAAALLGLNRLWELGLTTDRLLALAARLGSDVPFFVAARAAWCTGRGEVVAPFALKAPLHVLLAAPPVGLATAAVYRGVTVPARPEADGPMRAALAGGHVANVGAALFNRLQGPAAALCPEVSALLGALADLKPPGWLLSGSGSTCFALCRSRQEARAVARRLPAACRGPNFGPTTGQGLRLFVTRSCR